MTLQGFQNEHILLTEVNFNKSGSREQQTGIDVQGSCQLKWDKGRVKKKKGKE